ncbi:hypothetical protein B296_00017593 [Ensete ventricosum]|uniref:EF-hand domain-containing protein n=1 Tax=Ensete ventricosum TaxID=4639 RepID=A0A427B4Q4_ENSVE|nr:hypothetical protein B296_00017593 [Ensete ventricosum]
MSLLCINAVRRDTAVSHGQSPPHDAAPTASSAVRSDTLIYAAGTPQPPARSPSCRHVPAGPTTAHRLHVEYFTPSDLDPAALLGRPPPALPDPTAEDCRIMINKVDVDGDGRVDFKEFKQMMKAGGFAAFS